MITATCRSINRVFKKIINIYITSIKAVTAVTSLVSLGHLGDEAITS